MATESPSPVAILGLGYVGLPLAEAATRHRLVIGFDTKDVVVECLNAKSSHIQDVTSDQVAAMVDRGFTATSDPQRIAGADTFVICVPTPLSPHGGPDLEAVKSAGRTIAEILKPGDLVILESTTYPGTTDSILRPILEESGLTAGADFHLAFSPERIDPGNTHFNLSNTPKIVGGLTDSCRRAAVDFYQPFVGGVVDARGLREAEMAKLLENTYRHVNIALVNEMLRFSNDLGIDLWNVIDIASTKPFGFQAFYPGPGVGGHCIPIDPNYLSHFVRAQTGYAFRLVELAQEINAQMPAYVVSRLQDLLNTDGVSLNGARVLLLGVAYKPDISDDRESAAYPVARALLAKGANLSFNDPWITRFEPAGEAIEWIPLTEESLGSFDCVVLLQNHSAYSVDELVAKSRRFLDTRGVTPRGTAHHL